MSLGSLVLVHRAEIEGFGSDLLTLVGGSWCRWVYNHKALALHLMLASVLICRWLRSDQGYRLEIEIIVWVVFCEELWCQTLFAMNENQKQRSSKFQFLFTLSMDG